MIVTLIKFTWACNQLIVVLLADCDDSNLMVLSYKSYDLTHIILMTIQFEPLQFAISAKQSAACMIYWIRIISVWWSKSLSNSSKTTTCPAACMPLSNSFLTSRTIFNSLKTFWTHLSRHFVLFEPILNHFEFDRLFIFRQK